MAYHIVENNSSTGSTASIVVSTEHFIPRSHRSVEFDEENVSNNLDKCQTFTLLS